MSNRKAGRNIKHSGQGYFRKQAEKVAEVLAFTAGAKAVHVSMRQAAPSEEINHWVRVHHGANAVPVYHRNNRRI